MSASLRFWLAVSFAAFGSLGVYVGSFANAVALGSTFGYVAIFPGIAFIGVAPLPVKATSLLKWQSVFLGALRYFSLPVFLLGVIMLVPVVVKSFGERGEQIHGVSLAAVLTVSGLLAVTWPELLGLVQWSRRERRIDV